MFGLIRLAVFAASFFSFYSIACKELYDPCNPNVAGDCCEGLVCDRRGRCPRYFCHPANTTSTDVKDEPCTEE